MVRKWSKNGSKIVQKMVLKWFKTEQKWCINCPKWSKNRPKMVQNCSKNGPKLVKKMVKKWHQNGQNGQMVNVDSNVD